MTPILLFILIAVFLLLVGLGISYANLQKIIHILRTPPYQISTLPSNGLVQVVGNAKGSTVQSPIMHCDCLLWEVEIKENQGGKNSRWATVYKDAYKKDFVIHDQTGEIPVLLPNANFILENRKVAQTRFLGALDEDILTSVKNLGVKTKGFLGLNKSLQVHERLILPDDPVFVLGEIEYKEGRKSITSGANRSLVISNRGKNRLLYKLAWDVTWKLFLTILIGVWATFFLFNLVFPGGW